LKVDIEDEVYYQCVEVQKKYTGLTISAITKLGVDTIDFKAQLKAYKEGEERRKQKSIDVRTGYIFEELSIFSPYSPYPPDETFRIVSSFDAPVDYISFRGLSNKHIEELILLDTQLPKYISGDSKKQVRQCVKDGAVSFALLRPSDVGLGKGGRI